MEEVLTERLRLRTWTDADRPAFAAMNADPVVMEHLPAVLDRAGSDVLMDRLRDGLGRTRPRALGGRAAFRRGAARLGRAQPDARRARPGAGEWEIGWRLARAAWGHGYATEAATEGLRVARERGFPRVWSMTVPANVRSIAVMRRLGLVEHGPFDAPALPARATACATTSPTCSSSARRPEIRSLDAVPAPVLSVQAQRPGPIE